MTTGQYTLTVSRTDWRAVAAEVNRRLGANARGKPYTPRYVRLVRYGCLDSRRVSEVLDQILGPAQAAPGPAIPSPAAGGQP